MTLRAASDVHNAWHNANQQRLSDRKAKPPEDSINEKVRLLWTTLPALEELKCELGTKIEARSTGIRGQTEVCQLPIDLFGEWRHSVVADTTDFDEQLSRRHLYDTDLYKRAPLRLKKIIELMFENGYYLVFSTSSNRTDGCITSLHVSVSWTRQKGLRSLTKKARTGRRITT